MNSQSEKYHNQIAGYFKKKTLYLDEPTQKKPDTRKLVEQPWQQTSAKLWDEVTETLGDLFFIEAKCIAGLIFVLIGDYTYALNRLPENQLKLKEEKLKTGRVDRWTKEFTDYAKKWSERRDRLANSLPVDEDELKLPGPPPSCRIWTEEEIKSDYQRIMNNPGAPDKLEAFRIFVTSQSYPLIEYSRHPAFVQQHAFNYNPSGQVHDAAAKLLPELKPPYFKRHWKPDLTYNPTTALLGSFSCQVNVVFILPDGRSAVSGSPGGIKVWDLESGQCIKNLKAYNHFVDCISVTPDGHFAISASMDSKLIWDLDSGKCLHTLETRKKIYKKPCVSITPDGSRAISVNDSEKIQIWDLKNGNNFRNIELFNHSVESLAVTPDGLYAISGGTESLAGGKEYIGQIRVWNLESGNCTKILEGHTDAVTCIDVLQNGRYILSGSHDRTIRLWNLNKGECLLQIEAYGRVLAISSTIDGRWAVSGSDENIVQVWDLENGQCVKSFTGHTKQVHTVSINADGRFAISGSRDNTLRFWNIESGPSVPDFSAHLFGVKSINILADGKHAVWNVDQNLHLGDLVSGEIVKTIECQSSITCSDLVPNGPYIACGSIDHILGIWDLDTGKPLQTLLGHTHWVTSVNVTCEGKVAVTGSMDNYVRVWNLESGKCILIFPSNSKQGNCLSVDSDGRYAIVKTFYPPKNSTPSIQDYTMQVWDLKRGRCIRKLKGHNGDVTFIALSPDGRHALSGSEDMTLKLWNITNGRCLKTMQGHAGKIQCLKITPDGKRAVTGSYDSTLRVWDLEKCNCLLTLTGHTGSIGNIVITPDGLYAFSAGADWGLDRTIRCWDLKSGQCQAILHTSFPIQSMAFSATVASLICGTTSDDLLILELHGLRFDMPIPVNKEFISFNRAKKEWWKFWVRPTVS